MSRVLRSSESPISAPEVLRFNSKALNDRVTLYFWWEMSARDTYPDFDWVLRREDLEYLRQLDNDTLIERHPDAVELQGFVDVPHHNAQKPPERGRRRCVRRRAVVIGFQGAPRR